MAYKMCCKITFPRSRGREQLNLYRCCSVHIESSWKMLTDTAEIILPRRIREFSGGKISEFFQPGDPVLIELGYDNMLYTEFWGYIKSVETGVPVVIRCEDEMYQLKGRKINFSGKSVKLEDLLKSVAPGYEIDCYSGVELGKVRYSKVTPAQVLEDIQKKTGLYSYFDLKKLVVGKIYGDDAVREPARVHLEKNAVSQSLNFDGDKNRKVQVKALSINKGGKKLEVKVGEEGGDTYDLTFVGITVEVNLKKTAQREYQRMKESRISGSIVLFGIPRIKHGMVLEIQSMVNPDMNGSYYVEKVTKDFSDDATYRQNIDLGGKAK